MTFTSQSKVLAEPIPGPNGADSAPSSMPAHNPLLSVIGAFEDDPEYDALMEDIREHRRLLDAHEDQRVSKEDGKRLSPMSHDLTQ